MIINSSNIFFKNHITFVLLLFVPDNFCLFSSTSENKFINLFIVGFFKNSFPGNSTTSFNSFFSNFIFLSSFSLLSSLFVLIILSCSGNSLIFSLFSLFSSFSFFSSPCSFSSFFPSFFIPSFFFIFSTTFSKLVPANFKPILIPIFKSLKSRYLYKVLFSLEIVNI